MFSKVFLLSAAAFVVVSVMTVTAPLLPLIAHEFGRSVGAAGIVISAFAVPYGGFQIVFGPLGDRAGKLRVIALALGSSSVFVLGSGLAQSLDGLALMRFLSGMTMAGTVPLAMAYIADEVPFAERPVAIGRYVNGLVLGQITGGTLGGIAAQYFEWRRIFFCFAAAAIVMAVALWRAADREPLRGAAPHRSLREVLAIYAQVLRSPASRAVIVAGILEGFIVFGVGAYFGAYLRARFALGYATIGVVIAAYGVGGLIYGAAIRFIVRRLGECGMVLFGCSALATCYFALPWLPAWGYAVPLYALAGLGFYTFHNTLQTRATELSTEARGTAVALWVFMLFMGQGTGVTVIGHVIDRAGFGAAFSGAGLAIAALGSWFFRELGRRRPPA